MALQNHSAFGAHADLAAYLPDFTTIQDFLTDNAAVVQELAELNRNLTPRREADPCKKLWAELMEKEQRWRFSSTLAILTGQLQPHEFFDCLRNGYPIKDPGAGRSHGEYSHRIQWYMIAQRKQAGRFRLSHEVIDIYKTLGDARFLSDGGDSSPWVQLADSMTATNCTSPEWLNLEVAGFPGHVTLQGLGTFPELTQALSDRLAYRVTNKHVRQGRMHLRQLTSGAEEIVTKRADATTPGEWALHIS